MNFTEKISEIVKNKKIMAAIGGILILLLAMFMMINATGKEEPVTYEYESIIERKLAEDVKQYLDEYVVLEEHDSNIITNEAVSAYRTIMESGMHSITDDHTDALNNKMKKVLNEYASQVTNDDIEALASGISKIILDTILEQLEQSTIADMETYREEYELLADSLQMQIDALNEKSTSLNITAHIKDNRNDVNDVKNEIENEIYENVDKEISSMKQTIENISDGTDGKDGANGKDGVDGKDGVNGKNGSDGKDGVDGKNGTDGKDGANGKNGSDGKDGVDGKSTYIAYANDNKGNGFSLAPTETTKYIGTCSTNETTQPMEAARYNWQLYRSYVLKSVTDENGNTTLYIN